MENITRALIKENQRLIAEIEVKDMALGDLKAENKELIEWINRLEAQGQAAARQGGSNG